MLHCGVSLASPCPASECDAALALFPVPAPLARRFLSVFTTLQFNAVPASSPVIVGQAPEDSRSYRHGRDAERPVEFEARTQPSWRVSFDRPGA